MTVLQTVMTNDRFLVVKWFHQHLARLSLVVKGVSEICDLFQACNFVDDDRFEMNVIAVRTFRAKATHVIFTYCVSGHVQGQMLSSKAASCLSLHVKTPVAETSFIIWTSFVSLSSSVHLSKVA